MVIDGLPKHTLPPPEPARSYQRRPGRQDPAASGRL